MIVRIIVLVSTIRVPVRIKMLLIRKVVKIKANNNGIDTAIMALTTVTPVPLCVIDCFSTRTHQT